MKQTKKRGRFFAAFMAIITAFGIIPILGNATADAAIKTLYVNNTEAMKIINERMIKVEEKTITDDTGKKKTVKVNSTYYTPQMNRLKFKGKSGTKGLCTWCAFNNLLNRRVVLEGSTDFFEFKETVKVLSGSNHYEDINSSTIYLGDRETFPDLYDNTFTNGKGISYKAREGKFSSSDVNERKSQLVELLDEHPEGVVVQWNRTVDGTAQMHGFVISGYRYNTSNKKYEFFAVDTGSEESYASYKEGENTRLKDSLIGYGSKYKNNRDEDTIIKYLTSYVTLVPEPISIDLTGFRNNLSYGSSYGIPGSISSNAKIDKIYARVVCGLDQYRSTASYRKGHSKAGKKVEWTLTGVNARDFNIRGSAIDNNLSMGGLSKGDYYFEVTVTDTAGNSKTTRTAFSVK